MRYSVYFSDNGEPKTGLSPSIDIFIKSADGLSAGTAPTISEFSGGFYYFDYVPTEIVLIRVDSNDATMVAADRYIAMRVSTADNAVIGAGATATTITLTDSGGSPIADADVWITADAAGSNIVAGTRQTNSSGQAIFYLDFGITYYRWAQKDGITFSNPQSFVAS